MRNIIVTGGAGFIGHHLIKRLLLNPDNFVLCIDNFLTGTRENIREFFLTGRFKNWKIDIGNLQAMPQVINLLPSDLIDEIYNLACPASPAHYQTNPSHTTKTSVLGAIGVLELAKRYNARVLQASTSEIYGDPTISPQMESYWGNVNCNGLRSCYDEGKRCAETLFFDYHRQFKVDIRVIRIFNTYGPNMQVNDGRVVSNFIVQALKNLNLTVYGDGTQTRSFLYVDDLVDGMLKMMAQDTFYGPVNLGNPSEFTIIDFAKKVIEMTGSKSKIIYEPLPSDDPRLRKPDISLALEKLSWKPTVSIEEGLVPTIEYFKRLI